MPKLGGVCSIIQ